MAVLVACLKALRSEVDTLSPKRDKASDGWLGDAAHQSTVSDHNPDSRGLVHAIDLDNTGPWPAGWSMERIVQTIVLRHRSGEDQRAQNLIYMKRIWSRSWNWTARAYNGPNPHDHHAHFSARYGSGTGPANPENNASPWGLLTAPPTSTGDDQMAGISQQDFDARMDAWWTARMSPKAPDNVQRDALRVAPWQQLVGRTGRTTHDVLFSDMLVLLRQAAGGAVDEQAVVAGVLAGLNAGQIAAAVVAAMPADEAKKVVDELSARLAA